MSSRKVVNKPRLFVIDHLAIADFHETRSRNHEQGMRLVFPGSVFALESTIHSPPSKARLANMLLHEHNGYPQDLAVSHSIGLLSGHRLIRRSSRSRAYHIHMIGSHWISITFHLSRSVMALSCHWQWA